MKLKDIKPLLVERIYSDGDSLVITIQKHREASDKSQISTMIRRQALETNLKDSNGAVIYSLYNYVSSPEITNLLSSIKGRGPYKVNGNQLKTFLDQCAIAAEPVLSKIKPDVIIYPKSSSSLTAEFAKKIHDKHPSAQLVSDAFYKKILNAEDVEPLINTKHPDWEKFAANNPADVEKLKKSLSKMIRDHDGKLELKKMYKPYMKFIKNFVEMRDALEVLEAVLEKNVLVIDDVLSTGATMLEMIRQLVDNEPNSIAGLTIFKHTTSSTV